MAQTSHPPRPLAPDLQELLGFARERLASASSETRARAALEVERLERAVAFWEVEDEKTARSYRPFAVTLTVYGRTYRSDPLPRRFWERLLLELVADPSPRGLGRVLIYAFPLRRFRNWGLWASLRHPADVALCCDQLLGRGT